MKKYTSACWILVAACLLLTAWGQASYAHSPPSNVDESKEQAADIEESSRGAKDPLSIRIDLGAQTDLGKIDLHQPFRVVLTNTSDQPIRIWNRRTKNGYYQLSFHFVNSRTGKTHVARHAQIDEGGFWKWYEEGIEQGEETIELASKDVYVFHKKFGAIQGERRVWSGLPDPNSPDRFAVSARFESWIKSPNPARPVWSGRIQSEAVTAKFVASRLKKPQQYLRYGFADKALDLIKADPTWIGRRDRSLGTPLYVATKYGFTEVVEWLLENGADVNASGNYGYTPLHATSDPDVIKLILKKKPDLSVRPESQGQTPLQMAATNLVEARSASQERKWQAITKLYLDAGAEYDIMTAIRLDDIDRVKAILKQTPELADNFQDQSPLRIAASLGRLGICRHLIERYRVDVNDFERGVGYPIIKDAVAHPEVVRLLIEKGADLKTRITWQGGRTGIWIIDDDATALHFAARDGVPETVKLLIDAGVDIFATAHDMADKTATQTALEVAAIFGKADNAIAILNHPKFGKANDQIRKELLDKCLLVGTFGIWHCEKGAKPRLCEALLQKGADANADSVGVTVMQRAARQIHPGQRNENREIKMVIAILAKHGATFDLFSAVAIGDETLVARMLERNPKSANSRGPDGYPALHFAVGMNYQNIVKRLLDAGGDVDIRNKSDYQGAEEETALHAAAFWERYDIAQVLIDAGADVNALDEGKRTPLHDAAMRANLKIIRLLLEHGANMNARDADGTTPLERCHRSPEGQEIFRECRRAKKK